MTADNLKEQAFAKGLDTEQGQALWKAYLELRKLEDDKLKLSESEKKERFDKIIKICELVGTVFIIPIIGYACKLHFAKCVTYFELTNTFTTTPGKSIKDFFRW